MARHGGGVYNDRTGRNGAQPGGMPSAGRVKGAPGSRPTGKLRAGSGVPTNPGAAAKVGLDKAKQKISDSRSRG